MKGINCNSMAVGPHDITVLEPKSSDTNLSHLVNENKNEIDKLVLEQGALLFRGFAVKTVEEFNSFINVMAQQKMDYVYGSTPRTSIGDKIFTATEYPAEQEIPLHNECSYQRTWPLKISLCCLIPPTSGGETPIADIRRVTAALDKSLVDKFERLGVRYVRHYHPYIDVSWQKVFQTQDKNTMAAYCQSNNIQFEWIDENTLRTEQICQGTAYHPVSGERFFFNQAHLFHVTSLGAANAETLIQCFGPNRLPRQTYFGNGEEIPKADLEAIHAVYRAEQIAFKWEAGDVILLDNMRFAHGRRPFTGTRKVIAALMDSYTPKFTTVRQERKEVLA